jgi:hypothetical protein
MTKKEMIKILIDDEDNTLTSKELNKLNKDNVQEIFESLYEVEYEDEDHSKGLEFSEDYVEDPTIERTLVESVTHPEEIEEEEVVEIDISKLSTVEQRQYRRTGILPQITINRYTRFDDENPKMDN